MELAAFLKNQRKLSKNSMTVLIELAVVEEFVYDDLFSCKNHNLKRLKQSLASKYLRVPFIMGLDLSALPRNITDCVIIALSQMMRLAV